MDPLISIIVPVYNVEDYLDRCVESIVNQTYTNIEIILVDDGSTDSSGKKCDEWEGKDNRIVVIHKTNGGQAEARNFGLVKSKGNYIGFVDSDDCICKTMFEDLLHILVQNEADVVGCGRIVFDENNIPNFNHNNSESRIIVFNQKEALKDLITENHFQSTVWNLLVKASIAKSVQFEVGKIHEDILWPFRVFLKSQTMVYTSRCYYAYFQRSDSTMNKKYSSKRFDALDALQTRANEIKEVNPDLYWNANRAYLGACMFHYQSLCRQPKSEEYLEYKRFLHHRFCSGDQQTLFDGLCLKYKVWYTLFKMVPDLTCEIRNTLKIGT